MRAGAATAIAFAAASMVGCSLDLWGLQDMADGGGDAGVLDALAPLDGSVPSDSSATADTAGNGDDGAVTLDAPGETSAPDAGPLPDGACPGVMCNGTCTTATSCSGCHDANLLCAANDTCTADCTTCPGNPIECFACDITRANPIGTCAPDDPNTYCLNTTYAGEYDGGQGYHCACNQPSDCPGQTLVCISVGVGPMGCFTCGEAYTKDQQCNGGGKCGQGNAVCK